MRKMLGCELKVDSSYICFRGNGGVRSWKRWISPLQVGIGIRLWISGFGGRTDGQRESFEGGGLKFVVGNNVTRIPVYRRV